MSRQRTHPPSVAFLIAAARSRIRQATGAHAAGLKLTPTQLWMLVTLAERGPAPLGVLAAGVFADAPTASRVIETLHKRGLVSCACDATDRRRTVVSLTPDGERLARDAVVVADEVRATTVAGLSASEQEALRALLGKVIANFG